MSTKHETTMPAAAAPDRSRGQQLAGFIYASVWVLFLAVPIIAVVNSGAALGWKILAVGATVLFAVVYLRLAWRWFTEDCVEEVLEAGTGEPSSRALIASQLLLASIGALSLPAIGVWTVAYTPYMAALVVYTRPPRIGIPVGVLVWALPSAAAMFWTGFSNLWIAAGPGIGMLFVTAMRITEYYEEQGRDQAEALRRAEERDGIARDVHDVLGHSLTVLSIKAQLAHRLLEVDPARAREEVEQIDLLARESLGQVRSTVTRLKAPALPGELEVARTALEAAQILPVIRQDPSDEKMAVDHHGVLAWALREAVTNVLRHSGASRCEVELQPGRLRVADDGAGLGESPEGNGLRGLRERAARCGARVVIGRAYPDLEGAAPDRPGTQVEVSTL